VLGIVLVLVVVKELCPRRNALQRLDPDAAPADDGFAIRIARVIDEPRLIAVVRGVDARALIEDEQERVVAPHRLFLVPAVSLAVADLLAKVLDHLRSLQDVGSREGAESMDRRPAKLQPFVDRASLTGARLARLPGGGG